MLGTASTAMRTDTPKPAIDWAEYPDMPAFLTITRFKELFPIGHTKNL